MLLVYVHDSVSWVLLMAQEDPDVGLEATGSLAAEDTEQDIPFSSACALHSSHPQQGDPSSAETQATNVNISF